MNTCHQQEHIRQVVQGQRMTKWNQVNDRRDELVTDQVVVDLKQNTHDRKNENILRRPTRKTKSSATLPDEEESENTNRPPNNVHAKIRVRRQSVKYVKKFLIVFSLR
jgi:hypothetical protein